MRQRTALGLFSGGLDSILACRVVADQGVRVVALKFITPFFDSDLLAGRDDYAQAMQRQYGLEVAVVDISQGYLRMLDHPAHGFGKHFNPCIDCKILMLTKARELMATYGASFLITGEVLGQRPMSQRRDTLRVIERDSGCTGLLLRPLCAKLMNPTKAELEGLVDRERLYGYSGRSRRQQKLLAAQLGITDYPTPAGGCMLTDVNLASRIRHFHDGLFSFGQQERIADDFRLLVIGRQFKLGEDVWFILGRNERENQQLTALRGPDDWLLWMPERPGPLGLVRYGRQKVANAGESEVLRSLAGIVVRYGKKMEGAPAEVIIDRGDTLTKAVFDPLAEEACQQWRM
ncbi:MAG: thiamine biosynthesis protein [Desulfobulbaceae bacterium]|jgi:hypothetical protein|nr:thiamine biosynthesis protein [Desulfobulbaceae bacterium]